MARTPRRPSPVTVDRVAHPDRKLYATPRRARPAAGPQDGRWYWQGRYWSDEDGAERTCFRGWATREEVVAALRRLDEALDEATPPPPDDDAPDTVLDLLERWNAAIEARADLSAYTRRTYRTRLAQLRPALGAVLLDRIDRLTLERYRDTRIREGAAPTTLNKEFTVLGAAWAWGREVGICPDRSLPRLRVEERPVRGRYTPTDAEVVRVIGKLDGWPLVATRLLYATGARIGEVATARRSALDVGRSELRVSGKSGARVVPLDPDAVAQLVPLLPAMPAAWLCGAPPNVVRGHLWAFLRDACEAANVPRFSPHALRRAAVDAYARAGVEVAAAASIMGHSPEVMWRAYRRVNDEDRRAAVAKVRRGALPAGKLLTFPIGDP